VTTKKALPALKVVGSHPTGFACLPDKDALTPLRQIHNTYLNLSIGNCEQRFDEDAFGRQSHFEMIVASAFVRHWHLADNGKALLHASLPIATGKADIGDLNFNVRIVPISEVKHLRSPNWLFRIDHDRGGKFKVTVRRENCINGRRPGARLRQFDPIDMPLPVGILQG
jgi:hypothetical protein